MDDDEGTVGISRRGIIKRGAIVGGALMWAAPAVRTIGSASAASTNGSPSCTCGGAIIFCFACGTKAEQCFTATITCSNQACFCACLANGGQPTGGCTDCIPGLITGPTSMCGGAGQDPCPAGVPGRCP